MNITDERILEVLDTEGEMTPKKLAASGYIEPGRSYVNQRLSLLLKVGLTEMIGNGVYRISPKGRGYLAGQEDLRNVDKPV